jgi:hypothetical protein
VPNLRRSFNRRFPIGGQISPVRHIGRELSYILRTPNLRPLLISGDYVDWCRSVSGHRRIICYGGFRKARRDWKRNRQRVSRSKSASSRWHERYYLEHKSDVPRRRRRDGDGVIEPNTIVGSTVINGPRGRFSATILKNAQRGAAARSTICPQYITANSLVPPCHGGPVSNVRVEQASQAKGRGSAAQRMAAPSSAAASEHRRLQPDDSAPAEAIR